jgi:hypothetical protein
MIVTGDTVANEVVMTRQSYTGTIFVVEGDSDEKFFRKFTKDPEAAIISAWGKENALDAAKILYQENRRGCLTIVDADFWNIDQKVPSFPNVLYTDDHDVEMMMIRSDSFVSVVREMGSSGKLSRFTASGGLTGLRDFLLGKALCVGCLRWLSTLDNLGLRFEGLKFERFVDKDSIDVDIQALVKNVLALTGDNSLKTSDIVSKVQGMITTNRNEPYQMCCGHDFIVILGVGLRGALGSKSKEAAARETLEVAFRLSYDAASFMATQLYMRAKQWEHNNTPFLTFR